MENPMEARQEEDGLLRYAVGLERDLKKMQRAERVRCEMEQRYLALMESDVFLYAILTPGGAFRMMNRRAERFFGFQMKFNPVTLRSIAGPGYAGEVDGVLKEAAVKPVHFLLPVVRTDGTLGWLDAEFFPSVYQGGASVQLIATDVTEQVKKQSEEPAPPQSPDSPPHAMQILNGCPELLCFAVDKNGVLLYATRGYRDAAKRFLGHECVAGSPYPAASAAPSDKELQDLLRDVFRGGTRTTVLVKRREGGDMRWSVTAAPLLSASGEAAGAVVHLVPARAERETPLPLVPPAARETEPGTAKKNGVSPAELLNSIPRMFFVVDNDGRCIDANICFLNALKLDRDAVAGRLFTDLVLEGDPLNGRLPERFLPAVREKSFEDLECKICASDGEVLFLGLKGSRLRWGDEILTLVSCADNTRLRRTEDQLKRVSTTDVSTGILNRQGLERVLATETERASRYRGSLALIILDVDAFRRLNEQIGYAASDQVLRELVAAMKSHIRLTDFLGRWDGDEFLILTPLPLNTACQLAEKLRDMVQHKIFGENSFLTLSAGVAEYRKNLDVPAFVAQAYDAMTEAKRGGGNRVAQARGTGEPPEAAAR